MFASRLSKVFLNKTLKFSSVVPNTGIWSKYNEMLVKKPILTKCLTSAGISLTADLLCQVGFSEEFAKGLYSDIKIDLKRAIKFTAIGGVFVAPALHYWYGLLGAKIPGISMLAVLKRLSFDQLAFAPVFLATFFSVMLTLEGTPELIPQKLQSDWFSTVTTNFAVWVPAQFVNFRFIPGASQVLFANVVGFFWNIYLSYSCYNKPIIAAPTTLTEVDVTEEARAVVEFAPIALAVATIVDDDVHADEVVASLPSSDISHVIVAEEAVKFDDVAPVDPSNSFLSVGGVGSVPAEEDVSPIASFVPPVTDVVEDVKDQVELKKNE